jgi:hypothetical protein
MSKELWYVSRTDLTIPFKPAIRFGPSCMLMLALKHGGKDFFLLCLLSCQLIKCDLY